MTTLDDIRKHVLDDAVELIASIGMANPLVGAFDLSMLGLDKAAAAKFLRQLLPRHIILVLTRLHDFPKIGKTGETASIDSLLGYAEAESLISPDATKQFLSERKKLISTLEDNGIPYCVLTSFRHAELAHSLHPIVDRELGTLFYSTVLEFAHDTYELILKIENELIKAGAKPAPQSLSDTFHIWMDRGQAFWEALD